MAQVRFLEPLEMESVPTCMICHTDVDCCPGDSSLSFANIIVSKLDCGHCFHNSCLLEKDLFSGESFISRCPICRRTVDEEKIEESLAFQWYNEQEVYEDDDEDYFVVDEDNAEAIPPPPPEVKVHYKKYISETGKIWYGSDAASSYFFEDEAELCGWTRYVETCGKFWWFHERRAVYFFE